MAARELTMARRPALALRGVPVLMYHGLLPAGERPQGERATKYWIPEEIFRAHLELMAREGRRVERLHDAWAPDSGPTDPRPPITLTFDDGRASDYEVAFPALAGAGIGADFFVNTTAVGRAGYLSWPQVAEMQRAGHSFHSHSHDHVALLWLPHPVLERQLDHSKRMLEDRLGAPVRFLAVPYGLLNRQVVEMARQVGYQAVCSSLSWPSRPGRSPINRIAIHRDTSLVGLTALLRGDVLAFAGRAARAGITYLPKRILLRLQPARLGVRVLDPGV